TRDAYLALTGTEAEHRPKIDRFEGKLLIVFGEHLLALSHRCPGKANEDDFGRLIQRDADQAIGTEHRAILHQPSDLALRAMSHDFERGARVCRPGAEIGKLLHRIGSVEANAHMPGH